MAKITVLENEHASVWYYPETKIIHHQIKKYVYGQQLRDILNIGCEQFKKNGAHKWLSDDRLNGALSSEDTEWANNDWFPRVAAAGWKFWAIVMPEKIVGQMNMKKHAERYGAQGITVKVFSDPDLALKWLEEQ